jgi:threonylcarbamoyladenosine tRNA methylthiotransferase MtaB
MRRVALYTLGCKVNQYETRKLAEEFQSNGMEIVAFSDEADVYVINTCTVTGTADSKSRQAVRAAAHRNPKATVVVTGCYAETSPEKVKSIEGVGLVVGNRGKDQLVELVNSKFPPPGRGPARGGKIPNPKIRNPQSAPPSDGVPPQAGKSAIRNGRTRALLKVQDGCDQFCSYCVVPLARPCMSSRPFDEVIAEAKELASRGFKEVVLTGIRLGRYEDGGFDLADLLDRINEIEGIERIRLSSIELTDIHPRIADLIAHKSKLCRHLHIPLQSGSDDILAAMNRPYSAAQFEAFTEGIRGVIPEIAITTDVMVGFPGETSEDFERTYAFAERMKFARMHVFRFSARPGTEAAKLKNNVPATEKARRSARLIELGARCSHEFAAGLIGKTMPVLIEGPVLSEVEGKKIGASMRTGLTDNYIRVMFSGKVSVGEIVQVRIESVEGAVASGVLE